MKRSTGSASLPIIFAIALLLRIVFCFVAVPGLGIQSANGHEFFACADGYTDLAYTLAEYGRYAFTWSAPTTTFRGPPYPLAVAGLYCALRDVNAAAQIVNALASAGSAVLAVVIAGLVLPALSAPARYAAALLPLSIYYCASGFSDTFVAFAFLLYIWLVLRLLDRPSLGRGLLAGAALALAVLSKPIILPVALLLVVYAAIVRRPAVVPASAALALALMIVGGWSTRNYLVSGRFLLVSQGGGFNLLVGNYVLDEWSEADRGFKKAVRSATAEVERRTGRPVDPLAIRTAGHFDIHPDVDAEFGRVARQQFMDDPSLLPRKIGINLLRFWYFSSSPPRSAMSASLNFTLLGLGAVGLIGARRHRPVLLGFVVLFIAAYVGMYAAIIVNSTRYTLPVLLLLAAPAAQVVVEAWTAPARARRRARGTADERGAPAFAC